MAKKEKPKKEKKKKQKNDQAEGEKKGGKKKLLLLVPVLAGVGAGVYFFVLNGGGLPFLGGGKDKPIDVYAVEDEMVASVTAALLLLQNRRNYGSRPECLHGIPE